MGISRNQHIAKQMLNRTKHNRRCIVEVEDLQQCKLHSNRIYLLLPWTLFISFWTESGSQLAFLLVFINVLLVRAFMRWRGLFSSMRFACDTKPNKIVSIFIVVLILNRCRFLSVFVHSSVGFLPCGACANITSLTPLFLFSRPFFLTVFWNSEEKKISDIDTTNQLKS